MKKLIMIAALFTLVLTGCSTKEEEPKKEKDISGNRGVCDDSSDECSSTSMKDYEFLKDEEHVFLTTTWEQVEKRLAEDSTFTGIIYFGYPGCEWCQEAVPFMNEVAKASDFKINYVDKKSEVNMKQENAVVAVTKLLDDAFGLDKDDNGEPRIYVPEVIAVKDGKIVGHHLGTVDDHDATERRMSDKEQAELKTAYEELFSKLK